MNLSMNFIELMSGRQDNTRFFDGGNILHVGEHTYFLDSLRLAVVFGKKAIGSAYAK